MRKGIPSLAILAALLLGGCEASKSSNPLSPTVAGPIAGVNITAPQPLSPSPNAEIAIDQQPVTLTVKNAGTNGVRPLSYTFQVAADSGFAQQLYARAAIPPGESQTSEQVADKFGAPGTYYWRARAEDGANTGNWTSAVAFTIYIPVVIGAPNPVQPAAGTVVSTQRPVFTVGNAARTGPAGTIRYALQVAQDVAFTQGVLGGIFPEQTGQTAMTLDQDLPAGQQLFWRVQAGDDKNHGPWSPTLDFRTAAAPPPSPGPGPIPAPSPGTPAAADMFNLSAATMYNSPTDLASWPITTALSSVSITPSGFSVEFSKKDGAGRWPDVTPPGWSGGLQYTLGMCLNINGQWACSATIEFWNGLQESGGPPGQIARNWFYDPIRWGPMTGHQPAVGETIGFFVCAGDCRNNVKGDLSPVRERSNVVLIQMPPNSGGVFRF